MKYWIALILVSTCLSCLKSPKFDDDNGTPVTADQIQTQLDTAWGKFDPLEIKKSEFNYQEKSIQLSTLFPQLNLQKGMTVTDTIDDPTKNLRELHIVIQAKEILDNNQTKPSTRERVVFVNLPTPTPTPTATPNPSVAISEFHQGILSSLASAEKLALDPQKANDVHLSSEEGEISQLGVELFFNLMNLCVPPSPAMISQGLVNIECFNITVNKAVEPLPDLVAAQANCAGFRNCQMLVTNIQFDVVYTNYDSTTRLTTKTKVIYQVKLSSEVPFLSKLLNFCYQGMAASGNQRFPVTICTKTLNFIKGN